MSQVDAEAGIAGPPATGYAGPPATGYAGGSVWSQEPTANASFSGADLVSA